MEQLDTVPSAFGGGDAEDLAFLRALRPADFVAFLQHCGVPTEQYGRGHARCLRDLWAETVLRKSTLERAPAGLQGCALRRRVRLLVLELLAELAGTERLLLLRDEANDHGAQRKGLNQRVTKKMFDDEDIPSAVGRCLLQTLGIERGLAEECLDIESAEDVEETRESKAYPALETSYSLHVVRMRVRDPSNGKMACIGLPSGHDFTTRVMANALGVGRSRAWCWCDRAAFEAAKERWQVQLGDDVKLFRASTAELSSGCATALASLSLR